MRKARPCLAGAAALALAIAVAIIPTTKAQAESQLAPKMSPNMPPNPAPKSKDELARDLNSPYANTAIGAVIDANGGKVPASGEELVKTLAKFGNFVQLPVPFSAVALNSGLANPRIVMTLRPVMPSEQNISGGWGAKPPTLNQVAANHTQLEGRLFLAANTEIDASGNLKVRTVEFISWNNRKLKFEFGVIDGMGENAELRILDGVRCFACHKNKGPILGLSPWSNTAHNTLVQQGVEDTLRLRPSRSLDALSLSQSHGPEVDVAVRLGGNLMRDRAVFRQLLATPEGQKTFVSLCVAILSPGSLADNDKKIRNDLNTVPLARFMRESQIIHQVAFTSILSDYSPAGQVSKEVFSDRPEGFELRTANQVTLYDQERTAGNPNLHPTHMPSNPKAFFKPAVRPKVNPSEVISATLLAKTIGLTEKDREFLIVALDAVIKQLNSKTDTRLSVALQVFNGPSFTEALSVGHLPDRDEFKDRYIAGLKTIVRNPNVDNFWPDRDTYTSAPVFDPRAKPEKEVEVMPSHACLRCHDIQKGTKPAAFSPIPPLAFDPLDATAREAWLKTVDRKRKVEVLNRLVRRLAINKDMPPEDSTEAELYKVKDPALLNAAKEWLEAELKKVKAN